MNYLSLIDRQVELFENDISQNYDALGEIVSKGGFLVIGSAKKYFCISTDLSEMYTQRN